MSSSLFTILTATRNNGPYIKDYANSILAQTHRPLEVVYVDDASSGRPLMELESLRPKFKEADIQLRIIGLDRRVYCSSAYGIALKMANGDFFGVLDGDDALYPDATEFIMDLYKKYTKIGWIYTQFDIFDSGLQKRLKRGYSKAPRGKRSLLELGDRGEHTYSHWRTFSRRCNDIESVFKPGLRCAVDKHMGYRLEELAKGLFIDKPCYKYRLGVSNCISKTEPTRKVWRDVISQAKKRRKKEKSVPNPIISI